MELMTCGFSIDEVKEDFVVESVTKKQDTNIQGHSPSVSVANYHLLQDPNILKKIAGECPLARGTRYSLTCRDVGRVSQLSPFLSLKRG